MDNQANLNQTNMANTPNTGTPNTSAPNKKCSTMPIILLLVILALAGCGFGVYGMFFDNTAKTSTTTTQPASVDTLDEYAKRDVIEKTLRLLGRRNGLSINDKYNSETGTFVIYKDYMPIESLLSNSLTEQEKVYTLLETTILDKEKHCSFSNEDIKKDINSLNNLGNVDFGQFATFECISYDIAKQDYASLFDENLPKIKGLTLGSVGDFGYGSNADTYYYHIFGGRGGTSSSYAIGKINDVTKDSDTITVSLNAGDLSVGHGIKRAIYKDIEATAIYKEGSEDPDDPWDTMEFVNDLTDADYDALTAYNFIFKKNTDGIYSFKEVEKASASEE